MKKFFMAIAMAFVSMCASAQGFGGQFNPEDMAKRQATMLKDSCGINDEQYKKVLNLYVEQSKEMQKQMQEAMQNGGGGMGGFDREAMQKRQEAFNKKLKEVLTEEQFKKYTIMQENQRKRMMQMMQNMGGGFGGQR